MLFVPRRVHQCDGLLTPAAFQRFNRFRMILQFLPITAFELNPPDGIVIEPSAKFRTWRDFLQPEVQGRTLLRNPARPEPLDEDANPVAPGGGVIHTFNLNHGTGYPFSFA